MRSALVPEWKTKSPSEFATAMAWVPVRKAPAAVSPASAALPVIVRTSAARCMGPYSAVSTS